MLSSLYILIHFCHSIAPASVSTSTTATSVDIFPALFATPILGALIALFLGMLFGLVIVYIFLWLSLAAYFTLITGNLFIAWRKETPVSTRGPTHISISPLSIKLIWKGACFSTIGLMFGWDEITSVDLSESDAVPETNAACVTIIVQKGKTVHSLPIQLDGFASSEERFLFLRSIDSHLPKECKTQAFTDCLSDKSKLHALVNLDNPDLAQQMDYGEEARFVQKLLLLDGKKDKVDQSIIITGDSKDPVPEGALLSTKQKDDIGP